MPGTPSRPSSLSAGFPNVSMSYKDWFLGCVMSILCTHTKLIKIFIYIHNYIYIIFIYLDVCNYDGYTYLYYICVCVIDI